MAVIGKQTAFSVGSPEMTGHSSGKFSQPKKKSLFLSSRGVVAVSNLSVSKAFCLPCLISYQNFKM